MKLHLPVRLFRAILALMVAVPAVAYAEYTEPTKITIPNGYTEVLVDEIVDITSYTNYNSNVAFLLTRDLTIDRLTVSLMSTSSGSRYFSSYTETELASLTIQNGTNRPAFVFEKLDVSLEFADLDNLIIRNNHNTGYLYG